MLLRPRQKQFVTACRAALDKHGNTLGVAPTGAGKTVMLSKLAGQEVGTVGIFQHRDELTAQNRKTFHLVNPDAGRTGVVDSSYKEFGQRITFAMVPTLVRNLDRLQPTDLAIFDETHHIAATSYKNVLDRLRELNPSVKVLGLTATPQRGDKKSLRHVFDNVGDQILIGELIKTGTLVRPRTFVIDLGVQDELRHVRQNATDFDMKEVAKIMDHRPLNSQIVQHWKEKAGDRQTVVFCGTVEHAVHVCEAFAESGVSARLVHGNLSDGERKRILKDFDAGKFQVLTNVAVLTEGWDCQPVSCVVLLRPSSYKSTMIQMIGRGLRRLDPERYPGRHKTDCIVLDFGTSVLTHGSLEQDVSLEEERKGEAPKKVCPECESEVPLFTRECSICGHVFAEMGGTGGDGGGAVLEGNSELNFTLTEIDLFNQSPFKWEELWDGVALVANGFEAWGFTIFYQGEWHAVGGAQGSPVKYLAAGEKMLCLSAADDWLRQHENEDGAIKSKRWLRLPATQKQLMYLGLTDLQGMALSRYKASCLLTWKFNERHIQNKLMNATAARAA